MKEEMTMNTRKDWPCKEGPFRCRHTGCRTASAVPAPADAASAELHSFGFNTISAAPDGITPDEWRRGIALLAAASLHMPYGTSTANAIRDAREFARWIKEGDS
jgi:hypothetical protein